MPECTYDQKKEQTMAAICDPQPGDRYHEMFSVWRYVVDVSRWSVTIATLVGKDQWKVETMTKPQFVKRMTYSTIPHASYMMLADRGNDVSWAEQLIYDNGSDIRSPEGQE